MAHEDQPDPLLRQLAAREIYIERHFNGPYAQVRAIDAATGAEVAVTTPANAAQFDQHRLALRKLGQYLIAQGLMVLEGGEFFPASRTEKAADAPKDTSAALPKGGIYT